VANKIKLDKEEKGILDAYDKGSMNLSTPSRKEKEQIKSMAEKTFRGRRPCGKQIRLSVPE